MHKADTVTVVTGPCTLPGSTVISAFNVLKLSMFLPSDRPGLLPEEGIDRNKLGRNVGIKTLAMRI